VDVSRLILYTPNARAAQGVAKKLEIDPKTQLADPLLASVGDTGCAQVLIGLAHALETAKPGDRLVVASYGDGSDALVFRVTEVIASRRERLGVSYYLSRKRAMPSYGQYTLFRDLRRRPRGVEPGRLCEFRQDSSCTARSAASAGWSSSPPAVCVDCGGKDDFDDQKFARGKGSTFTNDYLVPSIRPRSRRWSTWTGAAACWSR
jgi:hypothetical protein